MYRILFSSRARKAFLRLPQDDVRRIRQALDALSQDPRTFGTIKLTNAPVADYRHRAGDYRILFEIDDENRHILIYDIVRRSERTYKR